MTAGTLPFSGAGAWLPMHQIFKVFWLQALTHKALAALISRAINIMSNPFAPDLLWQLADEFGTPLWVYDAATIRHRIAQLQAFDTVRFAQKACSNIHILQLMRQQGVKVDAVSRGEILRAIAAGFQPGFGEPAEIVFTADVMDEATLATVVEHQVPVNAGSIDMLHQLGQASPGHVVWLRINPGFGHGHSNKTNTGGEHSKHGIWHTDLTMALAVVAERGLQLAGLHMHIGSGVDYGHLQEVCGAMVQLVERAKAAGHDLQAISAGGGLSIPYREGDATIDTDHYFGLWDAARKQAEASLAITWGWSWSPAAFWWPSRGCCWARCAPPRMRAATTSCWSTPASTN